MVGALLQAEGFETAEAANGNAALATVDAAAPDAILLDLMMPGIGGFGVLSSVRRSAPNARTPVIIVSALLDKAAIARCRAAGANAFVAKPLEFAKLADAVRKELAARSKQA